MLIFVWPHLLFYRAIKCWVMKRMVVPQAAGCAGMSSISKGQSH